MEMERYEILEKIKAVIEVATDIPAEGIKNDSALMDDLELSSLEVMTIIADLEEIFGFTFSEKEMRNMITIDDLAVCIQKKAS